MSQVRIPKGLIPKGTTRTFSESTLPQAFSQEHSLRPGRWGVLHVLEGAVTFVDLASGKETNLQAPDLMTIAPEALHKLRLDRAAMTCRVDFFEQAEASTESRANEVERQGVVKASFQRCEAAGDFADKFYELFLSSSPEIAPHFAKTDFEKQRQLLRATVQMLVTRDVADPKVRETLERIGSSHGRTELGIAPLLYELWLETLCGTVRELDPEWSEVIEQAWRAHMRPGMQLITAAY